MYEEEKNKQKKTLKSYTHIDEITKGYALADGSDGYMTSDEIRVHKSSIAHINNGNIIAINNGMNKNIAE